MKKFKILNREYCYAPGNSDRLTWESYEERPWTVYGKGIKTFPTHAEAIEYADELARGWREVP